MLVLAPEQLALQEQLLGRWVPVQVRLSELQALGRRGQLLVLLVLPVLVPRW